MWCSSLPYSAMDFAIFLIMVSFIIDIPPKVSGENILSISCPLWGALWSDQKRSERIRVLPYSSIALMRSCFIELFFIALPPKQVVRTKPQMKFWFSFPARFALPLALAWRYYSTRFSRKKVVKLTSDGWILTCVNEIWTVYVLNYIHFMNNS